MYKTVQMFKSSVNMFFFYFQSARLSCNVLKCLSSTLLLICFTVCLQNLSDYSIHPCTCTKADCTVCAELYKCQVEDKRGISSKSYLMINSVCKSRLQEKNINPAPHQAGRCLGELDEHRILKNMFRWKYKRDSAAKLELKEKEPVKNKYQGSSRS